MTKTILEFNNPDVVVYEVQPDDSAKSLLNISGNLVIGVRESNEILDQMLGITEEKSVEMIKLAVDKHRNKI